MPSDARIKCWPLLVVHSHRNQKASKNLIGLCALTRFPSQQFPFFCPSPLQRAREKNTRARTHTRVHAHAHTDITTFVLPPTSTLAPALLVHTHTCMHTSVTIICMQSGWLRRVAMVAVTRLCDKKQQVALPLICANWKRCQRGDVWSRGENNTACRRTMGCGDNRDGDTGVTHRRST